MSKMDHQEREGSFLLDSSVHGRGRGRGESVSWHPSWLGSGVSPPSFGATVPVGQGSSVVGRGRGRANLLASMVSAATPHGQGIGTETTHRPDVQQYESESEESSGDEMRQLQQDHEEWRKQMEFMAERGRQLEEAMKNRGRKKKKRRETMFQQNFPVADGAPANCFVSPPMMCSTQAYGVSSVPVHQVVDSAAVFASDGSSVFDRGAGSGAGSGVGSGGDSGRPQNHSVIGGLRQAEDNSMWLRPRDVGSLQVQDGCPNSGHVRNVGGVIGGTSGLPVQHAQHDSGDVRGVRGVGDMRGVGDLPRLQGSRDNASLRSGSGQDGSVPLRDLSFSSVRNVGDVPSFSVNDLKKAWRRECKIKGTIGKIGDKENKLGYVDVERQIKMHESNAYTESEIIDAVINATQAGSTLRTLLQTSIDLNLETVKEILHSYFLEVDGGDLVTQLTKAKQTAQQDPQTFLMFCINLKNRIAKQKEEEGGMSLRGASKIMLKTLESGIASERIVNRLMPLFSKDSVTDAELIGAMSKAVIANKDRDSKGDKEKKSVKIAAVETRSREEEDEVYQMVAEIRSDVKGLRNSGGGKKVEYGCEACCLVGKGRSCTHCFYCGEEGHKYDVCPKKKSSNSNRSSTRD